MARWTEVAAAILRETFAREELPPPPQERPLPSRPSLLATLFAPEPLPEDPPATARPGGRWLAWLFRPERLDE